MKQIINLPGYNIQISEQEGVIVTAINHITITEVDFEEPQQANGIFIALEDGRIVSPELYTDGAAKGVLLRTKYSSVIIAKEDLPEMTWDEAIKHNPFDRHEAIEIYNNKEQINKALELIGGQPIKDEWYWTRDEYSTGGAWFYNGTLGLLNSGGKYGSYSVRPVTAF